MIPAYLNVYNLGLLDNRWTLVILGGISVYNMIITRTYFQNSIPGELYESAVIDGAGAWRRFRDITWPMMLPTISVLFLLGFIYTFKVFDLIYAMTKGGPANSSQILSYYSYEKSFTMFRFVEGAAASNISFLIIIVRRRRKDHEEAR